MFVLQTAISETMNEPQSGVNLVEMCFPQYHVDSSRECGHAHHPHVNKPPCGFSLLSPH